MASDGASSGAETAGRPTWVLGLNIAVFVASVAVGAAWLANDHERVIGQILLGFGFVVAARRLVMEAYYSDAGDRLEGTRRRMLEAKRQSGTAVLTTSGVVLGLIALNGADPGHPFQMAACALAATIALAFVHLNVVAGMLISKPPGRNAQHTEVFLLQAMQLTFLFGLISVAAGVLSG